MDAQAQGKFDAFLETGEMPEEAGGMEIEMENSTDIDFGMHLDPETGVIVIDDIIKVPENNARPSMSFGAMHNEAEQFERVLVS